MSYLDNLFNLNSVISLFKVHMTANNVEILMRIVLISISTLILYKVSSFFTNKLRKFIEKNNISTDERLILRAKTISEMSNNIIIVAISIISIMLIIGELGINLAPIIAGAGVLGLAISFGAQSLVKDIISGFFILLEDQYGVGDIIKVENVGGVVENMNLRTTILRDLEGNVHIVPNGEIRQVTVMTKLWSRAVIDIKVFYKQDIAQIFSIISQEANKLATEWTDRIVEPPELLGVDSIDPNGITIKLIIKTKSGKQWEVSREFRRRLIEKFNEADIDLPFFPSMNYPDSK